MKQESNRISSSVIAAVSAAFLVVGGGVAWLTLKSPHPSGTLSTQQPNPQLTQQPTQQTNNPPDTSQSIEPTQPSSPSPTEAAAEQTAKVYWLEDTGKSFKLVEQSVQVKADGNSPNQILEPAFQSLLAGPTAGTNSSTTIPKGTKLLGVKVEGDSVHVNLSPEFTSGGGSTSITGRVGQIVYTATAAKPDAKVYIDVDGKPLNVLGGEGLEIDQPLTRDSFDKNYPL